jgi:hypothetical protein
MSSNQDRIKPIRARDYSYYGFAKPRQEAAGRDIDECKEVAPKDTDKVLRNVTPLWWGLTDHPLPGHEITNVVKEVQD